MSEIKMDELGEFGDGPIFRHIRRYFCEYCGICQSKKTLITSHTNSCHKEELERVRVDKDHEVGGTKSNTCKECGASFKKPAYLVQHMQSYSLEKSNLHKHVKAVRFEEKPFVSSFPDCGMRFSYKHLRDKHENTGIHVYTHGDFEESDEQFRSRPWGGRKRECPTVEMLFRKRVALPNQLEHFLFGEDTE